MKKSNPFLMMGMIALSILTSFFCVFYGVNTILSESAPEWMTTFAYVTTAYGLANLSILSLAWSSREAWSSGASKLITLSYFGVFVMDAINSGINSATQILGILILALALFSNWYAVRLVIDRD